MTRLPKRITLICEVQVMARIKPNITFGHHSAGSRSPGAFGACGAAVNKGVTKLRASGAPLLRRFFFECRLLMFMRFGFDVRQYLTQISPYVIFYYLAYNLLPNYSYLVTGPDKKLIDKKAWGRIQDFLAWK